MSPRRRQDAIPTSVELTRLIRQAQTGDHEAFAALHRFLEPRLDRWLQRRYGGATSDREDMLQQIMVKVYRGLETYDSARGGFLAWTFALAANELSSHYRKRRDAEPMSPQAVDVTRETDGLRDELPRDEVAGFLDRDELRRHLRVLTRREAQVIVLRYAVDLSLRDAAAVLRTSEDAVSQTQRRALRKLRSAVAGRHVGDHPGGACEHACYRLPRGAAPRRLHVFTLLRPGLA